MTSTRRLIAAAATATSAILLCSCSSSQNPSPSTGSSSPSASHTAPTAHTVSCSPALEDSSFRNVDLSSLEETYDARIGAYARNTATGETVGWRIDERFPYASTIKSLAVGALLDDLGVEGLSRTMVDVQKSDIVDHSPVTSKQVGSSVSLEKIARAALRKSDNTAANYLFDALGGPAALQAALRDIGDDITTVSRTEPELNEGTPGDDRDTTSPQAAAGDLCEYALGDALEGDAQAQLIEWLTDSPSGDTLIRAGLDETWTVADKSGAAYFGSRVDVAIAWPDRSDPDRSNSSKGAPVVVTVFSARDHRSADYDDDLVAEAARALIDQL